MGPDQRENGQEQQLTLANQLIKMNSTALNCDPVGMELSYDDEGKSLIRPWKKCFWLLDNKQLTQIETFLRNSKICRKYVPEGTSFHQSSEVQLLCVNRK